MKIAATLAALSAVTLLWAAPAQQALSPVPEPLAPIPSADDFDGAAWAEALRSSDLSERKKAYESVLAEAGRRADVHEVVKGWAADESNVELAWTAQLMLRELDADPPGSLRTFRSPRWNASPFPGFGPRDLFEELDSLFDFGPATPFKTLPQIKDLFLEGQGSSRSEGLSIEAGPDGVKVELRELVDGKEEVKTYEAESMDALLEAHPELKDRIGGLRGLRQVEPRTDLLGIRMLPPDARRAPVEGVREGLGLEVVEVVPGTLADFLGLEVGDVVVSINGVEISSAEDVKRVLAEREKDAPVEVDVVSADEKNWTRTWKPAAK